MSSRASRLLFSSSIAALVGAMAIPAFATVPTLAPYPAPGGNTASWSGDPIVFGGRTWSMGGFDSTKYTKLYYAIGDYAPSGFIAGTPMLSFDGVARTLNFSAGSSNLSAGVAVWTGSTAQPPGAGVATYSTRFTLTVTDSSGNALALTNPASVGLPSALGGVLDVAGAYKANWFFEASSNGVTYAAAGPFFDSIPYKTFGASIASSVGGAFYYTPAVPEAGTWATMVVGLIAVGGLKVRRRASRA